MKFIVATLISCLATALGLSLMIDTPASANVNNFRITNFEIDYQLSRDNQQRSRLQTTETITAKFPQTDQNHGLERVIPNSYDGHPTNLKVESITNRQGDKLPYSVSTINDNSVIRIGDADKYVHGRQDYIISYSQQDVTKYFSDNNSQEFYWDTVGTSWRVPIDYLSISLNLDSQLVKALSGNQACYFGVEGSQETCRLAKSGSSYAITKTELAPGENISLAIGFKPGTFAEYKMSLTTLIFIIWALIQAVLTVIGLGLIIWLSVRFYRQYNRISELKPIAPEYLTPKNTSVVMSASLLGGQHSFTAFLLDLAVRGYIQIKEVKAKTWLKSAEFQIEIIKPVTDMGPEEIEILSDIFPGPVEPGAKLNLKSLQSNTKVYKKLSDNPKKIQKLTRDEYKLRAKNNQHSNWYRCFGFITLTLALILLSPALLIAALVAFIMSATIWSLTDKGLAVMRYLMGLKMYIKLAEADRIKTLQSPEGVEKVGDISDQVKLVKLYEKLLPYAVLFGVEKQWNKELGHYYEILHQQPDWYSGSTVGPAYSAAAFSSAMSSFQTTASYTAAGSSSTGGSSGGGSSGGGGGGGGGGGW